MLKAIIFDMDGVLIDTIPYVWKSFNTILKEENIHFSKEYIKKNLARSLRDNLKAWKEEFNIKDYDIMEFSKKATEIQLDFLKDEKPNKALINLLKQAKEQNLKCAVATSSLRWRTEKILDLLKIRTYFDAVVTANDVKNHKPSPDVFLEAAKQVNINPEECIVIEDAGNGIEAAKKGNMKAIGLITKHNSKEELKDADMIINDFSEIDIERLNELFKT